jgi:hypothetical protein
VQQSRLHGCSGCTQNVTFMNITEAKGAVTCKQLRLLHRLGIMECVAVQPAGLGIPCCWRLAWLGGMSSRGCTCRVAGERGGAKAQMQQQHRELAACVVSVTAMQAAQARGAHQVRSYLPFLMQGTVKCDPDHLTLLLTLQVKADPGKCECHCEFDMYA